MMFQHTAARRRLDGIVELLLKKDIVSTHSRPKAAGLRIRVIEPAIKVSTHSRPKAAGHDVKSGMDIYWFQHTAARRRLGLRLRQFVFFSHGFNTQPPEGGWKKPLMVLPIHFKFQHTAARRRLEPLSKALLHQVSQPRFR